MGRTRKINMEKSTEQDMQRAVLGHQQKRFRTVQQAADAYGVPHGTVYERLKRGRQQRKEAHESQLVLTAAEEKIVVQEIQVCNI